MTAPQIEAARKTLGSERLIVALDVDSADRAREVVADLEGAADTFKVGLQLFVNSGPRFVEDLVAAGKRVFLDLKFHDIPNTVAMAGIEAARLGVWMFNVHASGGAEMMARTKCEVAEFCEATDRACPLIIGVTILTSIDEKAMFEIYGDDDVAARVVHFAELSHRSGLDGVVASAMETTHIRSSIDDPGFLLVTPGVRPINGTKDDQKRVTSPGAAIAAGASHIVIGRPILAAADRRKAFLDILEEMAQAA
ncbi:MAG TPA: orotidine-5'-phosphate decarboxylase [Pyrinomonadaceae bacterium]|nr:orotidine-5'-phosphate decarboxylase [Pyrinomonadaceae bacterium]